MPNQNDHITISLNLTHAAIVLTALQDYQAGFEAAIHASTIDQTAGSIETLSDYIVFTEEITLTTKGIEHQIKLLNG